MSPIERSGGAVDLLCIAAGGGALGLAAADVLAIHDGDDAAEGVPSLELSALLGEGPGGARRRLRIAPPGAAPFDIVTAGALSVRHAPADALVPVPLWLAPLVAPIGGERLWIEGDALVLVADPARLAALCAPGGEGAAAPAGAPSRSHGQG